jgi:uncharacterized membrane protein
MPTYMQTTARPQTALQSPQTSHPSMASGIRRLLLAILLVAGIILLFISMYLFYFSMPDHCGENRDSQGVGIVFSSPEYISVGDSSEMYVTAVNNRSDAATVAVTMSYTGASLCLTEESRSHIIDFGSLSAHERATRRLEMQFPLCGKHPLPRVWLGQRVQFEMWLAVDNQPSQLLNTISLPVAPIARIRELNNWAWTLLAGVVVLLFKSLWELAK